MLDALFLVAPFFAIVLVGWVAGRLGVFGAAGLDGLNAFIFKIALPPLLFRVMMTAPDADAAVLPFALAWGAATLGLYVLARALARGAFGLRGGSDALYAHLAVNGNVGFLGLPLALAALGPAGALPTAVALTFDIVVVMTITNMSLEAAAKRGGFLRALFRALVNPITVAVFGGLAFGFYQSDIAAALDAFVGAALDDPSDAARLSEGVAAAAARFMDTLGQAAAPAALFATGATLAHRSLDRRAVELGSITAIKLVAHPLAVVVALFLLAPDLPVLWASAAILAAALPSSNNAVVFAGVFRTYEARASAVVLITTALSIVTFAVVLAQLPLLLSPGDMLGG